MVIVLCVEFPFSNTGNLHTVKKRKRQPHVVGGGGGGGGGGGLDDLMSLPPLKRPYLLSNPLFQILMGTFRI